MVRPKSTMWAPMPGLWRKAEPRICGNDELGRDAFILKADAGAFGVDVGDARRLGEQVVILAC